MGTLCSWLIIPKCQTSVIKGYHVTPASTTTGFTEIYRTGQSFVYTMPETCKAWSESGALFLALQEQVCLAFLYIHCFFILEMWKAWPYHEAVGGREGNEFQMYPDMVGKNPFYLAPSSTGNGFWLEPGDDFTIWKLVLLKNTFLILAFLLSLFEGKSNES